MKTMLKVLSIAALFAASTTFAMADTLTPFANESTFGTYTGQSITATTAAVPNSQDKHAFIATYTEQVFEGGSSALCSTCLNFVFTISNTASPTVTKDFIDLVTVGSFGLVDTKEGYVTGSGTDAPGTVQNIGGTITFNYPIPVGTNPGGVIRPGKSSDTLVIFTGAILTSDGDILFQDGAQAKGDAIVINATGSTRLSNAPEPSSLLLLGTGLLATVGVARRKLKA